jgi:hypothetical protein
VLGWATFHLPNRAKLSRTGDGFVALGITCLAYGVTEIAHGYGFLAVFVAALALRSTERGSQYHQKLHDFAEELERLLMMVLLVLLEERSPEAGSSTGLPGPQGPSPCWRSSWSDPWRGGSASWAPGVRRRSAPSSPSSASGASARCITSPTAWARRPFEAPNLLWATLGLTIVISVVLHGVTVTPTMRWLDSSTAKPQAPRAEICCGVARRPRRRRWTIRPDAGSLGREPSLARIGL